MTGDHPIRLRAPDFLGGGEVPALLRRTDQSFVEGLFRDLRTEAGRAKLVEQQLSKQQRDGDVLYQPVHRCHTLLLVEAYCDIPGEPPVDRRKIESAGLVLRRQVEVGAEGNAEWSRPQRWIIEDHKVLGWQEVRTDSEASEDPEAARRVARSSGNAEVDRQLTARRPVEPRFSEVSTRLHVLPPDVCAAVGRTLLFGVVQTADPQVADSPESVSSVVSSGAPGSPNAATYSDAEIRVMMPGWLRPSSSWRTLPNDLSGYVFESRNFGNDTLPNLKLFRSGRRPYADWAADSRPDWDEEGHGGFNKLPMPGGMGDARGESPGLGAVSEEGDGSNDADRLRRFITMLWQVRFQLRAFDTWTDEDGKVHDSDEAASFKAAMAGLNVQLVDGRVQSLYDFLSDASEVLVLREPGLRLVMPSYFPPISTGTSTGIQSAVKRSLTGQLRRLAANEGRFDNTGARYQIHAFVRARRPDGCAPQLIWAQPTRRRRVARWYEGGPDNAVLPQIELPSINRGFLKNLRPNVSVKVPASLFNFIQNNAPANFLEPEKLRRDSSGSAIQWICGFNISIIFIIAFMLLITFVLLLNIVFWWIFYFRICIPLPGGLFNPDKESA